MKCRTSEFQRVWSVSRRLDVIFFFFWRALESKLRFCPCGRGKWEKVCSKWYPSVLLGLGFILSAVGERLVPSRYMYSLSCCGDGAFVCRGTDAGKGLPLLLSLALSHTYSQALPHPFGCCELARNVLVTLNGNSMLYVRHVLLWLSIGTYRYGFPDFSITSYVCIQPQLLHTLTKTNMMGKGNQVTSPPKEHYWLRSSRPHACMSSSDAKTTSWQESSPIHHPLWQSNESLTR